MFILTTTAFTITITFWFIDQSVVESIRWGFETQDFACKLITLSCPELLK
jgi:hypothetical protein